MSGLDESINQLEQALLAVDQGATFYFTLQEEPTLAR